MLKHVYRLLACASGHGRDFPTYQFHAVQTTHHTNNSTPPSLAAKEVPRHGETIKAIELAEVACREEEDVSTATYIHLRVPSLNLAFFSAATNATHSPLLKLPAEIRQRIYDYVLGGNILHVASVETRGAVVCKNCDNLDHQASQPTLQHETSEFAQDALVTLAWNGEIDMMIDSHDQCWESTDRLSLSLLQTCRQIYHEGKSSSC